METDIGKALEILAVGMITIFVILALVFLVGKTLIRLVNRFSPNENVPPQ